MMCVLGGDCGDRLLKEKDVELCRRRQSSFDSCKVQGLLTQGDRSQQREIRREAESEKERGR